MGQLVGQIVTHTPTHNAKGVKISVWTKEDAPPSKSAALLLFTPLYITCEIRLPIVAAACSCILSVAWV